MADLDPFSEAHSTASSLMHALRQYRSAKRLSWWLFLTVPLSVILLGLAARGHPLPDLPDAAWEFLLYPFVGLFGLAGAGIKAMISRHRRALGEQFAQCDIACTPILFEFLSTAAELDTSSESRKEIEELHGYARTALLRLLPQLNQDHAPLFGSRPRTLWRCFLNQKPSSVADTELVIAVLKAWEFLADTQDLEIAERIADGRSPRSWPIKQSAAACVATLQERRRQQDALTTLLRPAASIASATEMQTLLRPHQNRQVSTPETLLRAGTAPAGSESGR